MFKKSCGTKVLSKLKVIMISISSSNILRSFQKVPIRKIMSKCWKHNNIVTTCVCSFYWETVLKHPPSYQIRLWHWWQAAHWRWHGHSWSRHWQEWTLTYQHISCHRTASRNEHFTFHSLIKKNWCQIEM